MSRAFRFELNRAGVRQLLRCEEVRAELERLARAIAAAGPGHEVDSTIGANRARASVWTATHEARLAEARHRRLTRAIDTARR